MLSPTLLLGSLAAVLPLPAEEVLARQFARLHSLCKPQAGESRYLDEIPWVASLAAARKQAAAEGKPIFLLSSINHSLGTS